MVNYVLPVLPPLAILIAIPLAVWAKSDLFDKAYKDASAVLCGVLILLPIVLIAVDWRFGLFEIQTILWEGLLVICAAMAIRNFINRRRVTAINWAFAATVIAILAFIFQIAPSLFELMSQHRFSMLVRENIKKGEAVCFVDTERESFAIYAGADKHYKIGIDDPNERKKLGELLGSEDNVYMLVSGDKNLKLLEEFSKRPLYKMAEYDKGVFKIFGHEFSLGRKFTLVTTKRITGN